MGDKKVDDKIMEAKKIENKEMKDKKNKKQREVVEKAKIHVHSFTSIDDYKIKVYATVVNKTIHFYFERFTSERPGKLTMEELFDFSLKDIINIHRAITEFLVADMGLVAEKLKYF
jgi:uncharacterized membrane protein